MRNQSLKNKIYNHDHNTTVEKKGNIVYKTFHHEFPRHMTKEWEKDYNDLSDINQSYVRELVKKILNLDDQVQ